MPQSKRTLAIRSGWAAGGIGFLLSFALSITVFLRQGNPGFLIIWLAAVIATGACMRAHARWRRSCERMFSPAPVRTSYSARKGRHQNVEDIAFRDIPDAAMSFSH